MLTVMKVTQRSTGTGEPSGGASWPDHQSEEDHLPKARGGFVFGAIVLAGCRTVVVADCAGRLPACSARPSWDLASLAISSGVDAETQCRRERQLVAHPGSRRRP